MNKTALLLASTLLLGASRHPEPQPDWIVGHWLDCSREGREVSETWVGGAGLWVGVGITRRSGQSVTQFEWMRIGPSSEGGLSFFASPQGAPQTEFRETARRGQNIEFSNPNHDFPQRVLYSRSGDVLTGAIQGGDGEQARRIVWTYRRAEIGEHCPGFETPA